MWLKQPAVFFVMVTRFGKSIIMKGVLWLVNKMEAEGRRF